MENQGGTWNLAVLGGEVGVRRKAIVMSGLHQAVSIGGGDGEGWSVQVELFCADAEGCEGCAGECHCGSGWFVVQMMCSVFIHYSYSV